MELNLIRRADFSFIPASEDDKQAALKIKRGQVVEANIKVLRNYKLLRKFWAMVNTAFNFLSPQQQEFFHDSADGFRCTLEVAAGYYDEFYDATRRAWVQKPKSIAFDKMDEAEFDKLYEDVVNVVFKLFLETNRVDRDTFYNALKDF